MPVNFHDNFARLFYAVILKQFTVNQFHTVCIFTIYPQYAFHYCQRNLPSTVSHIFKNRELNADNKPRRENKMKIHVLVRQFYSSKLE